MKIKKILKLILINIVVCITLLGILEFFCIYKEYKKIAKEGYKFSSHLNYLSNAYSNIDYINTNEIRPISYPTEFSNKSPLAIMGCSFAYGLWLNNNETLAAQLANKTHRVVYNLGIIGASPREMLYILRNEKLRYKLFDNRTDFEYIIYPYISDHLSRLHKQIKIFSQSPCFKKRGNSLEFYEPNTYLMRSKLYQEIIKIKHGKINGKESFALMCLYLKEINSEIKKYFPKAKFVVFIYEDHRNEDWSLLEKEGIKVINFTQLTNIYLYSSQYTISPNDGHPNAFAWETAVTVIEKELSL